MKMTGPKPRNHDRIKKLARLIRDRQRFILMTHDNPDGDALGSLLALGEGLKGLGKSVTMYCQGMSVHTFSFMPGIEEVADEPGDPSQYEVAVLLDCHALDRVSPKVSSMDRVPVVVVMDHHVTRDELPPDSILDTEAAATGELVYYLLNALKIGLTTDMAANLFVAISTDTGSFVYENTSAEALAVSSELVRLGARPWDIHRRLNMGHPVGRLRLLGQAISGMEYHYENRVAVMTVTQSMVASADVSTDDTDGFVDYPRSVQGVELAVMIKEIDDNVCKVSLRSLGRINTAQMAARFGGGGHEQAAGFTARNGIEAVRRDVIRVAGEYLPKDSGGAH